MNENENDDDLSYPLNLYFFPEDRPTERAKASTERDK